MDLAIVILFVGCGALVVLLLICYCASACPPDDQPVPRPLDDLPEVVQKLWYGKALYSQSFLLDYWMVIRNKHVVLTCFLAHPLHPFTKMDRLLVLVATVLFAYGIATITARTVNALLESDLLPEDFVTEWYELANQTLTADEVDELAAEVPPLGVGDLLMIVIAMVVQVFYDSFARVVGRCDCIAHTDEKQRPRLHAWLTQAQRVAGFLLIGSAAFVASIPVMAVVGQDIAEGTMSNTVLATRTWALSRVVSWVGTAMLVLLLATCCKRAKERRTNFGALRDRYGWTDARELPARPPDVCLLWGVCVEPDYYEKYRPRAPFEEIELERHRDTKLFGIHLNDQNRITAVDAGSAAAKAGLRVSDRVVSIDGARMRGRRVSEALGSLERAKLTIERRTRVGDLESNPFSGLPREPAAEPAAVAPSPEEPSAVEQSTESAVEPSSTEDPSGEGSEEPPKVRRLSSAEKFEGSSKDLTKAVHLPGPRSRKLSVMAKQEVAGATQCDGRHLGSVVSRDSYASEASQSCHSCQSRTCRTTEASRGCAASIAEEATEVSEAPEVSVASSVASSEISAAAGDEGEGKATHGHQKKRKKKTKRPEDAIIEEDASAAAGSVLAGSGDIEPRVRV